MATEELKMFCAIFFPSGRMKLSSSSAAGRGSLTGDIVE